MSNGGEIERDTVDEELLNMLTTSRGKYSHLAVKLAPQTVEKNTGLVDMIVEVGGLFESPNS
jgi:hypothetical protein